MGNVIGSLTNRVAKDPDLWLSPEQMPCDVFLLFWMSLLPDSRKLSSITIPGTHDSMARHGTDWHKCQSQALIWQLYAGIRFFDIHCRDFADGLPIHHGDVFQQCTFTDVIREMDQFLSGATRETIIVRVKEEHDKERSTMPFDEKVALVVSRFPGRFWTKSTIPTLGEARGKIVILQDFTSDKTLGIPWGACKIADLWDTNASEEKRKHVEDNLNAAKDGSPSEMFITFSSCSAGDWPSQNARKSNPKLHSYARDTSSRMGIVAMDFPGPHLIHHIICKHNPDFPYQNNPPIPV